MKQVSDQMKLGELAIPGTHDSGSYRISSDIGETQDWSIHQQLLNGIRFFDIRISNNHRSDDFELRHGILSLGSFKRLVMEHVKEFLTLYPSETILMSIKDEEDPLDVGRLERDFIQNSEYKFHLSTVNPGTTLGTVRGNIVLFNRYSSSSSLGIQWGNKDMTIQDDYNLDTKWLGLKGLDYPKKARKVVSLLKEAEHRLKENGNVHFFVNFASAHYKGIFIGNNAKVSNKAVLKYFQLNPATPVGCIIPMDYPNRVSGLINAIIDNNFMRLIEKVIESSQTDGLYGDFGNPTFCPENQFVFGYRLRSEAFQESGDDTALNDIELHCALKGNVGGYTTIHSSYTTYGSFKGYKYCGDNPVIGFDMKIESKQGSGDDTAANKVDLYCKNGGSISAETATSWGKWTPKLMCPSGMAVNGLSTRVESKQGGGDDTALNGLKLYCKMY